MEEQINQIKEVLGKSWNVGKEKLAQLEVFMKKHKVISGLILGFLIFLLLRKKGRND